MDDDTARRYSIRYWTRRIEENPSDPYNYVNRGRKYRLAGYYNLAIADFTQAISMYSRLTQAYYLRAECYQRINEFDLARADNITASRISPKQWLLFHLRHADILYNKGEYDRAIIAYTQVIWQNPKNIPVYLSRIQAYLRNKQYDYAIQDVTKFLKNPPLNYYAYYIIIIILRIEAYLAKKDYEHALADYAILMRERNYAEDYVGRGDIYCYLGQYNLALADYDQAIMLKSKDNELQQKRAEVLKHIDKG